MKKKLFGRILQQYREMFELLDGFHFNSTLTQSIFGSHLPHNRGSVISITHGDIEDRRRIRDYKEDCLHLIFIGNRTIYKGYHLLEKALLELEEEGLTKWQLDAWGGGAKRAHDRIQFCGTFSHSQLGEVFARDALLVVPSVWNEIEW